MSLVSDIIDGNLAAVQAVINRSNVNMAIAGGEKSLSIAVFYGRLVMVLWLIENGANVNQLGVCSITPLMRAYQNNQIKIAKLLIDHGADKMQLVESSSALILCESLKKHNVSLDEFVASLGDESVDSKMIGDSSLLDEF